LIAARYPDRRVHVVGDAAYVGEHLRNLGDQIGWTSRGEGHLGVARAAATLTGRSGRPRTRGIRLDTPTDLARIATITKTWRATQVRRYGRTDTVQISEFVCLWYGSFCGKPCGSSWSVMTNHEHAIVTTAVTASC